MQSPCEVGGGMEEEEEKKGGMRASYSQIYQPAWACGLQEISVQGAGRLLKSLKREGVRRLQVSRLPERELENLSSQNKTKC